MTTSKPTADAQKYAIADFDLAWCQRYLVAYIELMTPPEAGTSPLLPIGCVSFPASHLVSQPAPPAAVGRS